MINTMHLFAGAGGGLLADLILGHNPIVAVEWAEYQCRILRAKFPWVHVHEGDARMFDPSPWIGRVDCVSAGFPCNDISLAGTGAGIDGEHSGLWSEVRRTVGTIRPKFVFLENSPAITFRGIGRVLGHLAEMGYDARWCVLGADECGANHRRDRWWCLAVANGNGRQGQSVPDQQGSCDPDPGRRRTHVADTVRHGRQKPVQRRGIQTPSRDQIQAAAGCRERGGRWWTIEPELGRVADGVANRAHRIEAIGHGQVPICAAAAWAILGGPMNHEAPPNPKADRAGSEL